MSSPNNFIWGEAFEEGSSSNMNDNPFLKVSPLTQYRWKKIKRTSSEIEELYFPSARQTPLGFGESDNNFIAQEPECNCDLTPLRETIVYYERNGIKGYQKEGDEFLYNVKIFVSTDGIKIEQAYNECEPKDDEAVFFLENNINDSSKQKMFAKFGSKVQKHLILDLKSNGVTKSGLYSVPDFDYDKLTQLVEKGYVEEPFSITRALLNVVLSINMVMGALGKVLGWLCDTIGQAILDYLSLPEWVWNSDSDDYFLKRENMIKNFTISNSTVDSIAQLLKNAPVIYEFRTYIAAGFIDNTIDGALSGIRLFIDMYNAFVTTVINSVYDMFEGIVQTADSWLGLSEIFALLCGIWNGLVDFVGGTLKFIGTLLSAQYDIASNFDNVVELYDNFWVSLANFSFSDFWESIKETYQKIKDYFKEKDSEDINSDKVAYAVGFGIAFIATFFIPFTQLAKVASFSKVGKVFVPTKYLDDISNTITKGVNAAVDAGKGVADDAVTLINKMLQLLAKGKAGLTEFFEGIWKSIADWFLKQTAKIRKLKKLFVNDENIDELLRRISKKYNIAGEEILTINALKKLRKDLIDNFSVKLEFVTKNPKYKTKLKDWERRGVAGSFNPKLGVMFVRHEVTAYTIQHEMFHMLLWHKMKQSVETFKIYEKLTVVFHEEYVLAQFIKQKGLWRIEDITSDLDYVNRIRKTNGLDEVGFEYFENWNFEEELSKFVDL